MTTSAKSSPGPAVAAPEPEIHAALDLSVPRELLESLPATSGSELSPLLPPLFVDKGEAISPFQLSGRLISNEREDDYWSSIEGAELQFEFRQ